MNGNGTCVVVANGGRARIFVLKRPDHMLGESRRALIETKDLINSEQRLKDNEIYADKRSSVMHSSGAGVYHGVDANEDNHRHSVERRFAREVVDEVSRCCSEAGCGHTIMLAAPHFLGLLRSESGRISGELLTHAADVTAKSPSELEQYLAHQGYLS